jgi:hypothetical protein
MANGPQIIAPPNAHHSPSQQWFSAPQFHINANHGTTDINAKTHAGNTLLNSAGVIPVYTAVSNVIAGSVGLNLPAQGYQLDLSSSKSSVVVGSNLFNGAKSVTINVGGQDMTFRPGTRVTAAEYVAIQEVFANGQQTIVLSKQGTATGGSFSLNQIDSPKLDGLTIPQSVTAVDSLSSSGSITINGDLKNYGTISAVSNNPSITSAQIVAKDITNESGGLISTVSTSSSQNGTSLALDTNGNFINSGTITSGGSLSVATVKGAISNTAGASISAPGNVNLQVGSGNLTNAGSITSTSGNINIATPSVATNLNINAAGGTFQATAGAINVRDASYAGAANINMSGGNYNAQNLNLNAGTGAITGVVGNVSGNLNTTGNSEHFFANTQNLVLGNNKIDGDPTFASTGDITISGTNNFTESVAILAEGNINSTASASIVDPGQSVALIAGATVTVSAGATMNTSASTIPTSTQNLNGATGTSNGTGTFTASVDFTHPTGGNIDLTNSAGTVIDTRSATGVGGNVTLIAEANGGVGGVISMSESSNINAAFNGSGKLANGTVLMIAPNGIQIPSISNGSGAGANNITIVTAQPKTSDGNPVVFDQSGAQKSTNTILPDYSQIGTGAVTSAGSAAVLSASNQLSITAGGDVTLPGVFSQGALSVTTPGNINIASFIEAQGISLVAGGNITTTTEGKQILSAGTGISPGGNITIVAGASFTDDGTTTTVSGASSGGGNIDFNTNAISVLSSAVGTSASGGNGGNMTLAAFPGSISTIGGSINVPNTITTSGAGSSGKNGEFLAVGAQTSGGTAVTLGNLTTSGGAGGGGDVEIDAATPNAGAVAISQSTAGITSGTFSGGTPTNGTASVNSLTLNNANLTLNGASVPTIGTINGTIGAYQFTTDAGGVVTAGAVSAASVALVDTSSGGFVITGVTASGPITIWSNGDVDVSGITGGSVLVASGGNINFDGNITAPQGLIMVAEGSIQDGGGKPTLSTASVTGNAGNMTIVDGASWKLANDYSSITITGPSGKFGGFANGAGLFEDSTSKNGKGGNINIVSYSTFGNIQLGNDSTFNTIQTFGSGSNSNGNITAIAQTSIVLGDFETTNSPTGSVLTSNGTGTGGGGNITLLSVVPNAGAGVTISRATSDLPTTTAFQGGAPGNGNIQIAPTQLPAGATVTISASQGAAVETFNTTAAPNVQLIIAAGTSNSNGAINLGILGQTPPYTAVNAQTLVATAIGGNITSLGGLTVPGGIVLVSTASVTLGGPVSTSSGNAGNFTAVAGAAFTQGTGTITINGASGVGGNVDFSGTGSVTTATTASTGNGNGGNINAIAYGGTVNAQNTAITTGGFGAGNNGNILMISAGASITLAQSTNTTGGTGAGGNLTAETGNPSSKFTVSTTTSDLPSGNPAIGTWVNADINSSTGYSITVDHATITLNSGGSVNLHQVTGTNNSTLDIAADLALANQGNINFSSPVNINQITATVQAGGAGDANVISISAPLTAPGGMLLVSGGDISNNSALSTANANGNAGNMTLIAGAAFSQTATTVTITGASSEAGVNTPINMQGAALNSQSTATNGNGGNINLITFGGQINQQSAPLTTTGGNGTGTNGNVTVVAAGTAGQQILLSSIDTTGGQAGTGNVTILASTPTTSPNVVLSIATSDLSSGSFLGGSLSNSTLSISGNASNTINANGAVVSENTGGNLFPGVITNNSTSGSGGSIILDGSSVNLSQTSFSVNGAGNGDGGTISITGSTIGYTSPLTLSANGAGSGKGGSITYNQVSNAALDIGFNLILNANGGATGNGGSVTVNTQGLLSVDTSSLSVAPGTNGNGGSINFTAANLVSTSVTSPLTLTANGNGTGSGGNISVTVNQGPLVISSTAATPNPNSNLVLSATGASGGQVAVTSAGLLTVDPTQINVAASGANGSGGSISLTGTTIANGGTGTQLILAANGNGLGSGGQIYFDSTSNSAVTVGTLPGNFKFSTTGFSGGKIEVLSGGNLTVNPLALTATALGKNGNGGQIVLAAGNSSAGDLLVTAPIAVPGKGTGIGGSIILSSNDSTNAFQIGGKTSTKVPLLNGIIGVSSAKGKANGTFYAANLAGDVTDLVSLTGFSGITLTTSGAGSVNVGASFGSTKTAVILEAAGSGNITATKSSYTVTGSSVEVATNTGSIVGAGGTGQLAVSTPMLQILSGDNAALLDKIAITSIPVAQATNNLTIVDSRNITAGSTLTASTITLTSSGIVSNGTSPLNIATGTLTISGTASFNLLNQSASALTVNGQPLTIKSKAITLTNGGDIDVAGVLGSTSGIVSLTSTAGNVLTDVGGLISAKTLTLNTASGGAVGATGAGALNVNAITLNANANTFINVAENAATTTLGTLLANNGSVTINTAGVTAKVIQTLAATTKIPGASITANDGTITIQNNNVTKGSIVIGKGSQIATEGVSGGNVYIVMGAVPTPPFTAGPTPVGVSLNTTTPPSFFFGTNGITVAGTKPTAPTISLVSTGGGQVIFNTGSLKATAIKINGNTAASPTKITADPPAVGGALTSNDLTTPATTIIVPNGALSTAQNPVQQALSANSNTGFSSGELISAGSANLSQAPDNRLSYSQLPASATPGLAAYANAGVVSTSINQAMGSSTAARRDNHADWISETELSNGEIPAIVYSEDDLGTRSNVSMIVDLQTRASDTKQSADLHKSSNNTTQTASASLNHGTVVFAPTKDTSIETPLGTISIDAGSLVFVTASQDGLAVYNIYDSHSNAVVVRSNNRALALTPGKQALLTRQTKASFADVNPTQFIGYRNIQELSTTNGIKAFASEFSILHALAAVQPIKHMINSKNQRSQKLVNQALKTAAIITSLQGAGGVYQQVPRSYKLACAQSHLTP